MHYFAVAQNQQLRSFVFCHTEKTDCVFNGQFLGKKKKDAETMFRLCQWLYCEGGGDSFSYAIVSQHTCFDARFFGYWIPSEINPLVSWLDLGNYVDGFCTGAGLKRLSITNIIGSATPEDPLKQAIHLAKLWEQVRRLPESYARLNQEIALDAIGFEIQLRGGDVSMNGLGGN